MVGRDAEKTADIRPIAHESRMASLNCAAMSMPMLMPRDSMAALEIQGL
jgi:hypothetical protein